MKLVNTLAIFCLTAFTTILASPVGDQTTSPSIASGVAPVIAQFYAGVISSVAQLSPEAAQNADATVKNACDSIKTLNTTNAQVASGGATASGGSSILSPVSGAISSFVSAVLPTLAPFLTAAVGVATGDTSAAPSVVAVVQQTCNVVFNASGGEAGEQGASGTGTAPGVGGILGTVVNGVVRTVGNLLR